MAAAFKFLHAADLHLDRAIGGLAEVPPHLKGTLANAPYLAAENLFNLALAEKVDFILLAGDILDWEAAGPRATTFLLKQFERLAERDIFVYWCAGQVDPLERWPAAVPLPAQIVTFTSSGFDETVHRRNGQPIATIYGSGHYQTRTSLTELAVDADAALPIALFYDPNGKSPSSGIGVRYWALGGSHERSAVQLGTGWAVQPGTIQARSPAESGPRGGTLVKVDAVGAMRLEPIPLDIVRWTTQKLTVAESVSDDELKHLLADRALKLKAEAPDQVLLVDWQVATTGDFNPRLRNSEWRDRLVAWLRTEFGSSTKGVWTTDLRIDPTRTLPQAWYDEDTIRGDFLRAIGRLTADSDLSLRLQVYAPAQPDEWLGDATALETSDRDAILRAATLYGAEILGAFAERD